MNSAYPKPTGSAPRRITERGSLEIQAYDEACFPGLTAEWSKLGRPTTLCRHPDARLGDRCR